MTTKKLSYKIEYSQSFISSIIVFFMGLFFSFVMTIVISKLIGWSFFGIVILYLLYWNLRKDGELIIISQEEKEKLTISGKVNLKSTIKARHEGWSYAYYNPIQALKGRASHFLTPMSYNEGDERTIQNTFQKVIILELENGQNIALLQELLPWQEVRNLEYIGQRVETTTFDHELYVIW